MSNLLTVFDGFNRTAVGFDRIFDELLRVQNQQVQQNYPPYNIAKIDDTNIEIQVAVSGFSESDLDVTLTDGQLVITGENTQDEGEREWIHRGIAARKFIRTFRLADNIEVNGAAVKNGILTVSLEMIIPEEKKPRKILIASQ